jgi:hypothetical protein
MDAPWPPAFLVAPPTAAHSLSCLTLPCLAFPPAEFPPPDDVKIAAGNNMRNLADVQRKMSD